MPRALLEGRGDGAFIRLGDAMTATPEQHVHNFFAAHGKLGGAFLCANGAPCMVMDARMLRALDVQTKAMGQYIAQCGDDADPTRADTLVNMIAAEGLRVDLLAAVPGSALLEDTHGFSGLAIFDIDVHDNSPAGSVSFTLGGAAIAATLANERDAAADAMEAAPWASCDAYGGTQFNSVTIRRWASVKYIHVPKYYHISSWPPCVPTAPSTNKQLLSSPTRRVCNTGTTTTASNGTYTLSSVDAGLYTVEVSKSGYITSYFNVNVCGNVSSQDSSISPSMSRESVGKSFVFRIYLSLRARARRCAARDFGSTW